MALDYSGLLTRGGLNVGGRALGIANQVQDLKARQFGLAQAQEEANYLNQQRLAQQAAQQKQANLVAQAQELYRQGDVNAIADFSIANPELAKQIFNAQGYTQAEDMRRISNRFANVYASQDPIATLQQEVEAGEAQGLDMSDSRAILESGISGEEVRKLAGMTLASIDPNRQQAIAKAGGQSEIKPMTAYEKESIRVRDEANKIRSLETEEKALDRQISREQNELKKQELQLKLDKVKSDREKAEKESKFQAENAIATFDNSLKTIDKIIKSPGFSAAVGARLPFIDSLPGGDAQETIGLIETLQSQNFLNQIEKMKGLGGLSNAEGEKVAAAIGSLNRDMREKAFKRSLDDIKSFLEKGKKTVMKKYDVAESESTEAQGETINWADL